MEVLYMQFESERIEYKSQLIDDIYKEVIAFANTDGGYRSSIVISSNIILGDD